MAKPTAADVSWSPIRKLSPLSAQITTREVGLQPAIQAGGHLAVSHKKTGQICLREKPSVLLPLLRLELPPELKAWPALLRLLRGRHILHPLVRLLDRRLDELRLVRRFSNAATSPAPKPNTDYFAGSPVPEPQGPPEPEGRVRGTHTWSAAPERQRHEGQSLCADVFVRLWPELGKLQPSARAAWRHCRVRSLAVRSAKRKFDDFLQRAGGG